MPGVVRLSVIPLLREKIVNLKIPAARTRSSDGEEHIV